MIKYLNLNLVKPCCEWQVCILYNMSVQATIVNGENVNAKSSIVKTAQNVLPGLMYLPFMKKDDILCV